MPFPFSKFRIKNTAYSERKVKKMYTKYCHYCGKTFETDHEDEEFCCLECAIAHARVYLETLLDLQEERKPREKKA